MTVAFCDGHHIAGSQGPTHLYPRMQMTVLICGSPGDGFQIIGLFANNADAQSYAEDYSLKDWWAAEMIISPGAFAEGQRRKIQAGWPVYAVAQLAPPSSRARGSSRNVRHK